MNFITPEEKVQLEKLLGELRAQEKVLTLRISDARALGDLRENAEYHAAREDKAMNAAKMKEIEERIATAQIAGDMNIPADMVFVGAVVKLKDIEGGDEDMYKLVGQATGRFDLEYVEVTTTSPMGVALMKARIGEVVRVDLPRGTKRFEIVEIVL